MNQELERLKKLYSLFDITLDKGRIKVQKSSSNYQSFPLTSGGRLDHQYVRELDHEHMCKSIAKKLMNQHPNLHIAVFPNRRDLNCSVWLNRDGRDGEAIGGALVSALDFQAILYVMDSEAEQALQPNWFFCTGHTRAHPGELYDYFYFAGRYCKDWAEAHPEHKEAALKENYR